MCPAKKKDPKPVDPSPEESEPLEAETVDPIEKSAAASPGQASKARKAKAPPTSKAKAKAKPKAKAKAKPKAKAKTKATSKKKVPGKKASKEEEALEAEPVMEAEQDGMVSAAAGSEVPLEAEPVDEAGRPLAGDYRTQKGGATVGALASAPLPPQRSETETTMRKAVVVLLILLMLMFASFGIRDFFSDDDDDDLTPPLQSGMAMRWKEPVWLPRMPECVDPNNGQTFPEYAIGYEPTIAVDTEGNLYYTAHKDLRWAGPNGGLIAGGSPLLLACQPGGDTSWDYYASWFFVSQDGGTTWGPAPDWGAVDYGALYGGDEGDIGIDNNQQVYFVDTTLEDNWLHVWENGGSDYRDPATRLNSAAADDRPWVTAQGDGVVHYLGNSGTAIPCSNGNGRYWYYRSTDAGLTFSQCYTFPGGWTHIDAERDGPHTYVVQEVDDSGSGDIQVRVNDQEGALNAWSEPLIIGPREANPPEGFPWIATGPASNEGLVAAVWADAYGGRLGPWSVNLAVSWDYGINWTHWDITPFNGIFEYPNVYVGANNTVAVAFYGLEGEYEAGNEWHLYAAMVQDPEPGTPFDFTVADPHPLHTVNDFEVANQDVHALHDFFEIAIDPNDLSLNIAYQYNIDTHPFETNEEQRYLMYVKGEYVNGLGLASPSFEDGGDIPAKHTGEGADRSPALIWSEAPEGTESLAVVATDLDSGKVPFTHWLMWNVPAERESLPQGVPDRETVLGNATQGTNSFGYVGYGGPDPPSGENHTYRFTVYALDRYLDLEAGAKRLDLQKAMAGHVLSMGSLSGEYKA